MKALIKDQLSVVVSNTPGQIAKMCEILSKASVNISSIMFGDSAGQGVVRFIVDKTQTAAAAFEAAGFFVVVAPVAEVEFENKAGALWGLSKALGDAGVNIDYAYGSDNPDPKYTRVTFKFSDFDKALDVIAKL